MNKPRILFLCTGNSARSQMAEALLRAHAGEQFEVHSAGLEPKGYILPEVLEVMKERGLNMLAQTSKGVEEYLGKTVFSHTITVCGDAEENCPAISLSMGKHEHWPFDDPAKFQGNDLERLAFAPKIRDEIDSRIRQWLTDQNIQPV